MGKFSGYVLENIKVKKLLCKECFEFFLCTDLFLHRGQGDPLSLQPVKSAPRAPPQAQDASCSVPSCARAGVSRCSARALPQQGRLRWFYWEWKSSGWSSPASM